MKILLTNSPLHFTHGHTFTQADWQTLVLPTLAAIIGEKHEIRIVDNMALLFRSNVILEGINDFKPDVVAFSIIAARDTYNTIEIIKKVRKNYPEIILLAGGQGGSFFDKILLDNGIDIVCRGEGEITLAEIIRAITEKSKDYSSILGISFYRNGEYIKTNDRPKIKSLDDTSFPAIHLMPKRKSLWFSGSFTGSVETSRGCPFDCNFFSITSFLYTSFKIK